MEIDQIYLLIYEIIKKSQLEFEIDPVEVVKKVEEYRQYWKPDKIKIILLAESHIFTPPNEYEIKLRENDVIPFDIPRDFIRFIYCLGYGENKLLETPIKPNPGSWQFWKIFAACVATNKNDIEKKFEKVIIRGTQDLQERIQNKVDLLRKLKEKGIWLVDASIVGLYRNIKDANAKKKYNKDKQVLMKEIIPLCWENYIRDEIIHANPEKIIVIGIGVKKILKNQLESLKSNFEIDFKTIAQPQTPGDADEQKARYTQYYEIISNSS